MSNKTVELTAAQTTFLAALRDPEQKQTHGFLKTEEGMCCLGVATNCFIKVQKIKGWKESSLVFPKDSGQSDGYDRDRTVRSYSFDSEAGFLPTRVAKWLGFPNNDIVFSVGPGKGLTPISLNDSSKWTLPQIADAFEAEFLKMNAEKS